MIFRLKQGIQFAYLCQNIKHVSKHGVTFKALY